MTLDLGPKKGVCVCVCVCFPGIAMALKRQPCFNWPEVMGTSWSLGHVFFSGFGSIPAFCISGASSPLIFLPPLVAYLGDCTTFSIYLLPHPWQVAWQTWEAGGCRKGRQAFCTSFSAVSLGMAGFPAPKLAIIWKWSPHHSLWGLSQHHEKLTAEFGFSPGRTPLCERHSWLFTC